MYNRYIPRGNAYTRVPEPDIEDMPLPPPPQELPRQVPPRAAPPQVQEPMRPEPEQHFQENAPANGSRGGSPLSGLFSSLPFHLGSHGNGGLSGILKNLKLDDLDTGDILLMLILLFLFLESDDEELIITLALMLIIGL
jgi:hypothetical protein